MAIVLNQFTDGVLTTAQLNALVNAITAKFNGAITTGDLASPLRLPGNLDMNHFEILHLAKLWNVRNLAERSSGTSLQDVLTEINSAGGGVALLPADSIETVGSGGVTIGSNTIIMGHGESSLFTASGTMTNAMLRSLAPGTTGVMIVNCRVVGPATNDFDTIAFDRTSRCKFIDLKIEIAQAAGISFLSGAAGTSCVDTDVVRCHITSTGSADEGIFCQDIERLNVHDCRFVLGGTATTGVLFTATGASSNCEDVHITDNDFALSSGSRAAAIAAGSSAGILRMHVTDNSIEGAGAHSFAIDVDGGTATPDARSDFSHNSINGTFVDYGMRFRNLNGFVVDANQANITTGLGILIGATARSGSAATCRGYTVTNNRVTSGGSCYVFCHPGSGSLDAVIANNRGASSGATTGEFEIWNSGGAVSTLTLDTQITGNHVDDASASGASWRVYTDLGATKGGQLGTANNSNLALTGGNFTGTDFGNDGANREFHSVPEGATRKYQFVGIIT